MHCEGRSLYEGLVAPFLWADVRPVSAVYPFYTTVSAMTLVISSRCAYHDEQDHSFVQNLYHNSCKQKLLHFHCCFAVNWQSHLDDLRAEKFVVAAAACIYFGMVVRRNSLAVLASASAAGAQDYSSHPAPCGAGIAVQRRQQRQQGPFHLTYW